MCDNKGPLDSFADSLDPLHLDDTLFGNGDGHTSFDEFMIGQDDDDDYSGNSDFTGDEEDFGMDDGGVEKVPSTNAGNRPPVVSRPGPTITLTFSVAKPERKFPTEGMWKYFNGEDRWQFEQALIDHFPELESDYDDNSDLREIIKGTYEIDKPRAIAYLHWLWDSFPKEFFEYETDGFGSRSSYLCRGYLILPLIYENSRDPYLHEQLKTEKFLKAAFCDGIMPKHEINLPEAYIKTLLLCKDVDGAMKSYRAFSEGQKGRYGEVDIGKLWMDIVNAINWEEALSDKETLDLLTRIRPIVEELGIRGVKVIKKIDESLYNIEERLSYEEKDETRDSDDKEGSSGENGWREKYKELRKAFDEPDPLDYDKESAYLEKLNEYKNGWRTRVYKDNRYPIDPYAFESKEEYLQALKVAREKESAQWKEEKADSKTVYEFCQVSVDFPKTSGYYYFTNGLSLEIGDRVVVPFSNQNEEREGIVVAKGSCLGAVFPCSVGRIKKVIRKK